MKKYLIALMVLLVLFSTVACGKEEKKVVVASKPHSEQYILSEMISQLIEAKTDITVERKFGIGGGTSNIHPGMVSGEIDIYPEYTGTGWLFVLKKDLVRDPEELYMKTKELYESEYGILWLDRYGFNNTFALALEEGKAKEMGIESYSDLSEKGKELVFGAEYDFFEREDGFPGLVKEYGFSFSDEKELDIGLKYQAIGNDEVDVINAFSTDGLIKEYNLKVLKDDKNYFPSYECATLVRKETLEKYPELKDVLNSMANAISDKEMQDLNYKVEKENALPEKVAEEFLKMKGLL
ncbi:MAG: glycine/betaine ABC transporter substrate-binding protein [Firmicutes bacterium]|jgi:glycine betaine/choline ABC-type transport system substrate-binding protein|nr:glycine/betaine ABC transporter substrate-binding protein [Bacillota bacterium]